MSVEIGLHFLLVVIGYGDIDIVENDAEAIDHLNLRHVNDIGTMGAQEFGLGQILVQLLHRHERHHTLAILQIEAHIVFQTFDVEDVVETDALKLIIALDKHETIALAGVLLQGGDKPLESLVGGFEEILVGDGLQKVVERTDLVAFDGILGEGRGEDDLRLTRQDLGNSTPESSGIWMSRKRSWTGFSRSTFMACMALLKTPFSSR